VDYGNQLFENKSGYVAPQKSYDMPDIIDGDDDDRK